MDDGITTFEQEFMAHIVVGADHMTIGEQWLPKIRQQAELGQMPKLALPGVSR